MLLVRACLLSVTMLLLGTCLATAQGPQFDGPSFDGPTFRGPTLGGPENFQDVTPIPGVGGGAARATDGTIILPEVDGAPVPLANCACEFYDRVCYKDKKHIAPCAETMVVSVLDPCSRKCDCETKCVQVRICVPTCTCGCPKVKVSRNGRHTRYDYGKYAIDIFSNRNGTILVDYDA